MKNPPFFPIGSIIYDRDTEQSFEVTGMIGQGGFAQCFSIKNAATDEEFAAKIIKKSELSRPKNKQKLLSEIKIHLSLNHKNIVKLFTYFEDKNFVFLIMEMCHNKSMMDLLKKSRVIEEKYVRIFLLQIISALEYLHKECSVIHRDMKLANLFLDKSFNIKVGDFGLAAVVDREEKKKTICGTPNYIAPEVLFNSADGHSFEVDIWSVGVVIYTMIVGKPPFQKNDVKEIYKCIKANSYTYPEDCKISENAKDLISGLLELDPKKRYTLEEIYHSRFLKEYAEEPAELPNLQAQPPSHSHPPSALTKENTYTQTKATAPLLSQPTASKLPQPSQSIATRLGLLSAVHISVLSLLNTQFQSTSISSRCIKDYVIHTVDHTNRYGLGYILASGTIGILFNDCTSIVLRSTAVEEARQKSTKYYFEYFEHKVYGVQKIITKEKHHMENISQKLTKKVQLIQYFINALFSRPRIPASASDEGAFVIKHVNFARGPVLRLSNRNIVFVIDGRSLVFSDEGKTLFFEGSPTIEREILTYCHEVLTILLAK